MADLAIGPRYALVMIVSLMLITAVGAIGLLRTLPPPGRLAAARLAGGPGVPRRYCPGHKQLGLSGPLAAVGGVPCRLLCSDA